MFGANDWSAEGVAEIEYWMIRVQNEKDEMCVKVESALVLSRLPDVGRFC
jgi:hypothetical protein